jgi:hypothetical protein
MLSRRITGRLFSKKALLKDSLKSSQVMAGSLDNPPTRSGPLRRETGMMSGGNQQHPSNSSGKNLILQKVTASFYEEMRTSE